MYLFIAIHIYIYIYLLVYFDIYIYIYMCVCISVCEREQVWVCVCVYVCGVCVCIYFIMNGLGPMAFHCLPLQHSCFLGPLPTEGCGCRAHGVALLGLRQCWSCAEPSQGQHYSSRFEDLGNHKVWLLIVQWPIVTPRISSFLDLWVELEVHGLDRKSGVRIPSINCCPWKSQKVTLCDLIGIQEIQPPCLLSSCVHRCWH